MGVYKNKGKGSGLDLIAGGTLYADLPIGSWIKNDMDTLPSGFLKEGDAISQSEYPELYAKYGSTVPYKADTSELSDYSTPITFEQITTGYTMPYDGVLNIGANSTAGSVIANVTVNGVLVVKIGTTSYTGSFVRFRKGDVIKANNIVSENYVLKVAYYKKSLIVKAKQVAAPAPANVFKSEDFSVDSQKEVSLLPVRRVYNGTRAAWDLLSVAEKTQYGATAFTDDEGGDFPLTSEAIQLISEVDVNLARVIRYGKLVIIALDSITATSSIPQYTTIASGLPVPYTGASEAGQNVASGRITPSTYLYVSNAGTLCVGVGGWDGSRGDGSIVYVTND